MKQIVCERCQQVVAKGDEEKVKEIALVDGDGGMVMLGDFCPRCLRELRRWLNPPQAAPGKGSATPKSTLRRRRARNPE